MSGRFQLATPAALTLILASAIPALGQLQPGTPVDRNVADTGPNAASQRLAQPGLGQFGVGSLLLDRHGNQPAQPTLHDPYAGDPRTNQRYLMQSPGVTVLTDRPSYVGPSPQGGWVYNQQTFDGTAVFTLTASNTVFVLSPELLRPTPIRDDVQPDHPSRVQPRMQHDPYAVMRDAEINHNAYAPRQHAPPARPDTYVHPEIIERRRKLKEEREREILEARAKAEAEAQNTSEDKEETEETNPTD